VGARNDLQIDKKPGTPTFPGNKVEKKSDIKVKNTIMPNGTLKIAMRIKSGQIVDFFEMKSKAGAALVLTPVPAGDAQITDLTTALPLASDEKWVMYTAPYVGTMGTKFETTLRLDPNAAHANGFQVITTAVTYVGINFADGHYVFGISLLAGKNNAGQPFALGTGAAAASKKKPKKPAKKKAGKSKGKKKK
jgi:hypothetical protein